MNMSGARVKFWCIFLRCRFGISPHDSNICLKSNWRFFTSREPPTSTSRRKNDPDVSKQQHCVILKGLPKTKSISSFQAFIRLPRRQAHLQRHLLHLIQRYSQTCHWAIPSREEVWSDVAWETNGVFFAVRVLQFHRRKTQGFPSKLPKK